MNTKITGKEPEVEEIIFTDEAINENAAKLAKLIGRIYGTGIARN